MTSKPTPEQLSTLKRLLEAKRDDLRKKSNRHVRAATLSESNERAEQGNVAETEHEIADTVGLAEHEQRELDEVLHALEKLARGTYGVSEATGRPIPYARLEALPWARFGVDEP